MRPKPIETRGTGPFLLDFIGFAGFMENASRVRVPSRALYCNKKTSEGDVFFVAIEPRRGSKVRGLRSAPVGAKQTSPGRPAPSRALEKSSFY